jgi:hypothetical protein
MSNAGVDSPTEPSPTRVVADADVLAADLLVDGDARRALDIVRSHSWLTLVASDPLLEEAEALVETLADGALAGAWREKIETLREPVDQPAGDNPALASAYQGGAMHVLSFDERLTSATGAARIRTRIETSVRPPGAFAALFDATSLYREAVGGEYPGPDRNPRE